MSAVPMPSRAQQADDLRSTREYVEHYRVVRGRVCMPLVPGTKKPRDGKGWSTTAPDAFRFEVGDGLAWRLDGITDVDKDCWEAMQLAADFQLPTGVESGRPAAGLPSHAWYLCESDSEKFQDIDGAVLLELRSGNGFYTQVPSTAKMPASERYGQWPSERAIWYADAEFGTPDPDTLRTRVVHWAIATILVRHLGANRFGHPVRLAWAGYFLGLNVEHLDQMTLIHMGEAISRLTNNTEVGDVRACVTSTADKLARDSKKDEKVAGRGAFAKHLGPRGAEVLKRIEEWLHWKRPSKAKVSQDAIRDALTNLGVRFSYNVFTGVPLATFGDATPVIADDGVIKPLWLQMEREIGSIPGKDLFWTIIEVEARANAFHPVLDYLKTLVWDGVSRLDTWLIVYGHAKDTPFIRAASGKTLIALVRRVRHPGCKHDELCVLESETQGVGKSSALRTLCPHEDWFSDDLPLNVDSKQMIERTAGKWIIETPELSKMRATDTEQLKATLSRQEDGPCRLAYDRTPSIRKRHFVIIGTTNGTRYLKDHTGNRRFWPVRTPRFDLKGLLAVRDQLWAEAAHREAAGESNRLEPELWDAAAQEQEARFEVDDWEDRLREWLDCEINGSTAHVATPRTQATPQELYDGALELTTAFVDQRVTRRVADAMTRLGWTRKSESLGKDPVTGKKKTRWVWVRGGVQGNCLTNKEED